VTAMPTSGRPRPLSWHLWIILLVLSAGLFASRYIPGRANDEAVHLECIRGFVEFSPQSVPELSTFPGFHVLAALWVRAVGDCSVNSVRAFNALLAMLAVAVVFDYLRRERPADARRRLWLFVLMPLALPYYFHVFTDTLSLLLAVATFWLLAARDRTHLAAIAAVANVLVRQSNVVWLLFVAAYPLFESGWPSLTWRSALSYLEDSWVALIGVVAFAGFVLVNGGVDLSDSSAHQLSPSLGNLYFFLFLLFLLWMPLHAAAMWHNRRRLRSPWLLAVLAVAYVGYHFGFRVTHPFNYIPGCLHNDLLHMFGATPATRALFFLIAAGGICALWATPLRRRPYYLWFPAAAATLIPVEHIEHRYYIVPAAAFILLRRSTSWWGDLATILFNGAVCAALLYAIVEYPCFL